MKKCMLVISFLCLSLLGLKAQSWVEINALGFKAYNEKDYTNAFIYFEQAVSLAKKEFGKKHVNYALSLNNLAQMYDYSRQYEKAAELFIESAAIRKELLGENSLDYAWSLNNLASVYGKMNRYEKAEQFYSESATIRKKMLGENHPDYASSINNQAQMYSEMGQYEKAEPLFLQAATIYKENLGENNASYALVLNNLAVLYKKQGIYNKAELLFLEAISIKKNTLGENHPGYATSVNNLAQLYEFIGQYEKAKTLYLQSAEIRKQSLGEDHETYAASLNNLAVLYRKMGDFDQAELLFIESISIKKNALGESNLSYGTGLQNLAALYHMQRKYKKAEPLYLEALAIDEMLLGENHPAYATDLSNLGVLYQQLGQYEDALSYHMKALGIFNISLGTLHPDYATCLTNTASLYWELGNYAKAGSLYEEAKNIVLQNIQRNFGFLSETEKEKYISSITFEFETYQSFYYSHYQADHQMGGAAFDIQLATRGLILNEKMELKKFILMEGGDSVAEIFDQWKKYNLLIAKELSKPLADRSVDLTGWTDQANLLEKSLTRSSNAFKKNQASFSHWKNIQEHLKPSEAALEFISFNYNNGKHWTDSVRYSVMIIRQGDTTPVYIPLFEEKQLKGLFSGDSLRTFANLLYTDAQVRTVENNISYGDSLYQLIWEPLEPYLKNVKEVYYSPSGYLHHLTFDAIPMPDTKLLSDKYSLNRLTSTAKLLEVDTGTFIPTSIALFGGIQYNVDTVLLKTMAIKHGENKGKNDNMVSGALVIDTVSRGGSWSYLAGAKKEVQNISDLLNKNKITSVMFTEELGTEEEVKNLDAKNSPSILHFSTHGFFFPDPIKKKEDIDKQVVNNETVFKYSDNPLFRSGLILAGANYVWKGGEPMEGVEDGILTAHEVSNLYLPNTKLVVMSACETGLGDIKGSEGVYGLQRAFKMAGVEYIIMTLWKVLDKETSDFMTLFYQNLLTKKSIPKAFKATQDTMKNKYRDEPYKWAGFVLMR